MPGNRAGAAVATALVVAVAVSACAAGPAVDGAAATLPQAYTRQAVPNPTPSVGVAGGDAQHFRLGQDLPDNGGNCSALRSSTVSSSRPSSLIPTFWPAGRAAVSAGRSARTAGRVRSPVPGHGVGHPPEHQRWHDLSRRAGLRDQSLSGQHRRLLYARSLRRRTARAPGAAGSGGSAEFSARGELSDAGRQRRHQRDPAGLRALADRGDPADSGHRG